MDLVIAASLLIHLTTMLLAAAASGRVSVIGRIFLFFALFYSVAPVLEFEEFKFFQYTIDYEYRGAVLMAYSLTLVGLTIVALSVFHVKSNFNVEKSSFIHQRLDGMGLRALWAIALFAWFVDLAFNWNYFNLPKHEYILSLSDQTRNLFFFSIPDKELLAGAMVFNPFRGRWRYVVRVVGALALLHSVLLGYRHIALLVLLLLLGSHIRSIGMILLCVSITFLGEVSNVIKAIFLAPGEIQIDVVDPVWWGTYLSANIDVSSEQKAILSNFLIKLSNPWLFEQGRVFYDFMSSVPFFGRYATDLGIEIEPASRALGSFVGTLEGQGTAYSIHLTVIESYGMIFPVIALVAIIGRSVANGMLTILVAELFYSIMRNSPEFWMAQLNKLIFLSLVVWFYPRIILLIGYGDRDVSRHVREVASASGVSDSPRLA